jgi:hypothetical protein
MLNVRIQKKRGLQNTLITNKQAARIPTANNTTGSGFAFMSRNSNLDLTDKPTHSTVENYLPLNKRNSSMQEYNLKGDMEILKGHKRFKQDVKNVHMTMTKQLPAWEGEQCTSPGSGTMKKYSSDKLKKLTMRLGTGASRNITTKGILTSSSKGIKKKYKSPKYLTQNIGSYYLKGKNTSVLST